MTIGLCRGGKFQLVRPGVLRHWCPGCSAPHDIDVHAISRDGHVLGWDGDLERPSIGERMRHDTPHGICEYVLRSGVLYFAPECWHPLANQQRHMENFPA
jgi:hypothetical protein